MSTGDLNEASYALMSARRRALVFACVLVVLLGSSLFVAKEVRAQQHVQGRGAVGAVGPKFASPPAANPARPPASQEPVQRSAAPPASQPVRAEPAGQSVQTPGYQAPVHQAPEPAYRAPAPQPQAYQQPSYQEPAYVAPVHQRPVPQAAVEPVHAPASQQTYAPQPVAPQPAVAPQPSEKRAKPVQAQRPGASSPVGQGVMEPPGRAEHRSVEKTANKGNKPAKHNKTALPPGQSNHLRAPGQGKHQRFNRPVGKLTDKSSAKPPVGQKPESSPGERNHFEPPGQAKRQVNSPPAGREVVEPIAERESGNPPSETLNPVVRTVPERGERQEVGPLSEVQPVAGTNSSIKGDRLPDTFSSTSFARAADGSVERGEPANPVASRPGVDEKSSPRISSATGVASSAVGGTWSHVGSNASSVSEPLLSVAYAALDRVRETMSLLFERMTSLLGGNRPSNNVEERGPPRSVVPLAPGPNSPPSSASSGIGSSSGGGFAPLLAAALAIILIAAPYRSHVWRPYESPKLELVPQLIPERPG